MWLSRQMAAQAAHTSGAVDGRVTQARERLTVQADGEYRALPVYAPSGVAAIPCLGDDALLLEAGGEKRLIGVRCDTAGLEPGELRLRSAGGAEILLKNDGQVVVNGQVFAPKQEG